MKKIYLIFLVIIFCSIVPAQKKATDREMEGFKGAVKTVVEDYMLTYVSSGPSKVNERVKYKEYYFDKNGNLTQVLYPSYNFKHIFSIIDGNKTFKDLPIKVENRPKNGGFAVSDEEEEPIEKPEKLVPPDDRFTLRYAYEFDSQGKLTIERHYGNNGKLWRLTTYKYDEKGRVIEEKQIDSIAITKYTNKYDKNGNLIETLGDRDIKTAGIDSKSKTVFSDYKIDAQGNWTYRKKTYNTDARNDTYSTMALEYRTLTYY